MYSLWQDLSHCTIIFYLLTLKFYLLLKNFNLGHNFLTRRDRTFTLHLCIPCDKAFNMVPSFLTSRPWTWSLTYFWKTFTLAITFLPEEIRLSYSACVFLLTRPFTWCHNSWPWKFDLLLKNFNHGFHLVMVAAPASVVVFWQLLLCGIPVSFADNKTPLKPHRMHLIAISHFLSFGALRLLNDPLKLEMSHWNKIERAIWQTHCEKCYPNPWKESFVQVTRIKIIMVGYLM